MQKKITVLCANISKAHERWIMYRSAAETLKRMRSEYLTDRSLLIKERGETDESVLKLDQEFLYKMEEYMGNENQQWRELRSEKKTQQV